MDALELNGVTYVKASAIARDLGYTSDYVGQLCRSGKVDAQLVGRSWYVHEQSIRDHKKSRYRSNTAKTVNALKETISVREDKSEAQEEVALHRHTVSPSKHFYTRASESVPHYAEDQTELIPTVNRPQAEKSQVKTEVRPVESRSVSVKKVEKPYTLTPTKRPKIRFKGEVSIVEPAEDIKKDDVPKEKKSDEKAKVKVVPSVEKKTPVAADAKTVHPKDQLRKKSFKVAVTSDVSDVTQDTHEKIAVQHSRSVAMKRSTIAHVKNGEVRVAKTPKIATETSTGRYTFLYIVASLSLALLLVAGFMLIESSVVATEGSLDRQYTLNVSAVINAIKGLK